MPELRGVITGIRWNDPETDRVIADLRTADGQTATVIGEDTEKVVAKDAALLVVGDWRDDEVRGPQFHATAFVRVQPQTRDGILRYLREVAGLMDGEARKCYRRWGADTIATLRDDPATVVASGVIESAIARVIAQRLTRDVQFQEARLGLATLFAGRRFPTGVIAACIGRWGERAPDFVRADPFILLGLPGRPVGFKRVDDLYLACGGRPDRLKRQTLLVCWLIETAGRGVEDECLRLDFGDGDTWVRATVLAKALEKYPGLQAIDRVTGRLQSLARPLQAFELGIRMRLLIRRRDAQDRLWLTTPPRDAAERTIVGSLSALLCAVAPL